MAKPKRTTKRASRKAPATAAKRARRSPAAKALHGVRFPNESARYRASRDALLQAEIGLRREIERVAALRRKLPVGGAVPMDYEFEQGGSDIADTQTVRRVRLSELFGDKDTLVIYSYMYGPAMEKPCPMCTSILDGLDGNSEHINQRVSFVVIAKSPIGRIRDFARSRGWSHLRLLSSAGNSYNRDYQGENDKGSQLPALNAFVQLDGQLRHSYCTELLFAPSDKGQSARHVDMIWPLWNMFDFTPAGRGSDWHPKLIYG